MEEYRERIEELKAESKKVILNTVVEIKKINEDSIGHSYENLFKHILNEKVTTVEIQDAYIKEPAQVSFQKTDSYKANKFLEKQLRQIH